MGQAHHEVLVFRHTVWLSIWFEAAKCSQRWRVYKRPDKAYCGHNAPSSWWLGLDPMGTIVEHMLEQDLPKPVLRAYAFTDFSGDVPKRPYGTDLWVQGNAPNQYEIWYSPLSWEHCLSSCAQDWVFVGIGYWEPA